jgi:uncharacterized protein YndB with AHSA1/START domain
MLHADATLEDDQGRTILRFERVLRHPPERVWRALTELGDLRSWHPSPFEFEPRLGGAVRFLPPDGDVFGEGRVTAFDPPLLLGYTWGEDLLLWQLEPHDDGCRLVLTHTFDDHYKAARDAAGWTICLAKLERTLSGEEPPSGDGGEDAPPPEWRELNAEYEKRFGIPPDKATPIPGRAQ